MVSCVFKLFIGCFLLGNSLMTYPMGMRELPEDKVDHTKTIEQSIRNIELFGALCCCLKAGDDDSFKRVFEDLTDYSLDDSAGKTLLHLAAHHGRSKIVRLLLNHGYAPNARDNKGRTPLHSAVLKDNHAVVTELFSEKVCLEIEDFAGCSPFLYVTSEVLLDLFIKEGANLTAVDAAGYTILHKAIQQHESDWVSLLMQRGVPVNVFDNEGASIVHHAVNRGNRHILSCLLLAGAEPNTLDADGYTPLHNAVSANRKDLCLLLLSHGADPAARNRLLQAPLHIAASHGFDEICNALISFPVGLPTASQITASHKRILTALCCLRRYVKLPQEIIFMIFCGDTVLVQDLSTLLLLSCHKMLQGRKSKISITNNTEWRLKITYTVNGNDYDTVVVPGECTQLPVEEKLMQSLSASIYGKVWGVCQLHSLDLLKDVQPDDEKHLSDDLDIVISGGHTHVTQFIEPFTVVHRYVKTSMSEPISLIPKSYRLIDAFPLVKYKMQKDGQEHVRPCYFLGLPANASDRSIQEAYERLVSLWEYEKCAHGENREFVSAVLKVLDSAYRQLSFTLLEEVTEEHYDLSQRIGSTKFAKVDPEHWLREGLLMKRPLSRDILIEFFKERSIIKQSDILQMIDHNNLTPEECALIEGNEGLVKMLAVDLVRKNFSNKIQQCIRRAFYYEPRETLLPDSGMDEMLQKTNKALQKTIRGVRATAGVVFALSGTAVLTVGCIPIESLAPGASYTLLYNVHLIENYISGVESEFIL